jgi:hypothetical protein
VKSFNKENNLLLVQERPLHFSESESECEAAMRRPIIPNRIFSFFQKDKKPQNSAAQLAMPLTIVEEIKMELTSERMSTSLSDDAEESFGAEEEDGYTQSSANTSPKLNAPKMNLSRVVDDNESDDSDKETKATLTSFGVLSNAAAAVGPIGQKFNTLRPIRVNKSNIDATQLLKYNTGDRRQVISANKFDSTVNNLSSFKICNSPISRQNTAIDSVNDINPVEECCQQGFYWDITDWNGGIGDPKSMHTLNNTKLSIVTSQNIQMEENLANNDSMLSAGLDFSPIYSKNFNKAANKNDTTLTSSFKQTDLGLSDSEDNARLAKSLTTNTNYMYLFNSAEEVDTDSYYEKTSIQQVQK